MKKPWFLYLTLLIVMFSGCTEKTGPITPNQTQVIRTGLPPSGTPTPMGTIPFESLDKGDSSTVELEKPAIFVAGSPDETGNFTGWLGANVATRIQQIDFKTTWVIAVFRGKMDTSGYGIEVQEINLAPGTVQIKVNLTDPSPERMVQPVISYPYQIILVPKGKLQVAPGTIWVMYDLKSSEIAKIKYP